VRSREDGRVAAQGLGSRSDAIFLVILISIEKKILFYYHMHGKKNNYFDAGTTTRLIGKI
jgi:hypothetical protein